MVMKQPMRLVKPPQTHTDAKVGAAQVFGRGQLPQRPIAPESAGPDKDAQIKKKKMGAAEVFGPRR
jgi:hypothetical protein